MASLPPQPSQRRRSSPGQQSNASQASQASQRSDASPSNTSEDSQTVMVNAPGEQEESPAGLSSPPPLRRQDTDLKKCWICFADESEDTPETSKWRSPCPCALVAHEECLLDWIADMESPTSRKKSLTQTKILCPQCKSEIHLARPWDPLVQSYKALQRVSARYTTPAILVTASSTVVHAFSLHGVHTIFTIFGQDDGWRILRPFLLAYRDHGPFDLRAALLDIGTHWRLRAGLPLITPALILSRFTIADSILPILPILFFATQTESREPINFIQWPPSAALTISVLPYIRGVYNAFYARVCAPYEKKWLKEIQPRAGETSQGENNGNGDQAQEANNDNNDDDDDDNGEGEGVFEIRVDGNLWDFGDGNDRDQQQDQNARGRDNGAQQDRAPAEVIEEAAAVDMAQRRADAREGGHAINDPPLADADAALNVDDQVVDHVDVPRQRPAQAQAPRQPQQQPAQGQQNRDRRLSISTTGLAEKVLGALLFPSIASLSGELLRLLLPVSWTSPQVMRRFLGVPVHDKDRGILQSKWGRSIVGGCLFVVLKDAMVLYVRWKMAEQHRSRRVLDYDKRKKRVVNT